MLENVKGRSFKVDYICSLLIFIFNNFSLIPQPFLPDLKIYYGRILSGGRNKKKEKDQPFLSRD
jgi:hypothetical protein